jgi:uncharacterized caspase-like protein
MNRKASYTDRWARLAIRGAVAGLALIALQTALYAQPAGKRRALLIGINDYSASRLPRYSQPPVPGRDWPDLSGPVNDVRILREMLIVLHGFAASDIVTLTDQEATRVAILRKIESHLVESASKGDISFFYFAGHGSQVENSRSDEPDKLDESIVPADSRKGAPDIRDKELRPLFNRILDRGARLTILLDNCHSGSGIRGLVTGAQPRGVKRDPRDIADPSAFGPRPEDRGALVLSASQDSEPAMEFRDEQKVIHGAFTWALIRAMRDSSEGETAHETFLRARARLQVDVPFQEPVIAGDSAARVTPLLGTRIDRRGGRTVVAVEKVQKDGTIVLNGGWATGLSVGSELRVPSDRDAAVRVIVTTLRSLRRAEARVQNARTVPSAIRAGSLLELVGWAAPPSRPLRIWIPAGPAGFSDMTAWGRRMADASAKRGVRWVPDPTDVTPTHLLRYDSRGWSLLGPARQFEYLGNTDAAIAAIGRIAAGSSLFVQLPAPAPLISGITSGFDTSAQNIDRVKSPGEADYVLAGRYAKSSRSIEYAWVRPGMRAQDRRKTGFPARTDWIAANERHPAMRNAVSSLRDAAMRLRRIHGWLALDSPPHTRSPYRLALRRLRDGRLLTDRIVTGGDSYEIVLRAASPLGRVARRYVYVFVIDSHGKSFLVFPQTTGSVENRFPLGSSAPSEIPLGQAGSFRVTKPYGMDTWFLLTTEVPLSYPWILEWDGVRTRSPESPTPLEQLLMLTAAGERSGLLVSPENWSIEKLVLESVPPRESARRRGR